MKDDHKANQKQVVFVHGGTAWPSEVAFQDYLVNYPQERLVEKMLRTTTSWSRTLGDVLGQEYEVLAPPMPCAQNARYKYWSLWFDKIIPFLHDGVIFVGHSLGGIFLAKYLSEHTLSVCIAQLHLVAAPVENTPDESLCDFNFTDLADISVIQERVDTIYLYHSEDDSVVPFKDVSVYAHYLPQAEIVRFIDRGHFLSETFPELVFRIKKDNLLK